MLTELFRILSRAGVAAAVLGVATPASAGAAPAAAKTPVTKKVTVPRKHTVASKAKASASPAKVTAAPPAPPPSPAASQLLAWIAASADNGDLPYLVIDKQAASLSLFSATGELLGTTPVLLGIGVGDDSSPGIGAKDLADIGPAERTTPAGRFVAKFGRAFGGVRVLWVDYANSVAIHAVITTHKKEHRVQRLLSPTPDDNRISFGCINVGTSFYAKRIRPLFGKGGGVVYILPDTKPLEEVFPRVRLLPYLNVASAAPAGQAAPEGTRVGEPD